MDECLAGLEQWREQRAREREVGVEYVGDGFLWV